MRNPIEERTGKHVAGTRQILRFARIGGNVVFLALESNERTIGAVRHHAVRHHVLEPGEGVRGTRRFRHRDRFGRVAEEQIGGDEGTVKGVAEDLGDERIRAGERDLHALCFRGLQGFLDRVLARVRIREDVTFHEQPLARRDPLRWHVPGCEVARDRQARAHRPLGVRRDDTHARARRFTHER